MKSNKPSPIWPYLGILACLFGFCVAAPRSWERLARPNSAAQTLALRYRSAARTAPSQQIAARGVAFDRSTPAVAAPPAEAAIASQVSEAQVAPLAPLPADEPVVAATSFEAGFDKQMRVLAQQVGDALVETRDDAPDDTHDESPDPPQGQVAADLPPAPRAHEPLEPSPPAQTEHSNNSEPAVTDEIVGRRFPLPVTLLEQLDDLHRSTAGTHWCDRAVSLIRELCDAPRENRSTAEILNDLRATGDSAQAMTVSLADAPLEARLLRVRYALARHVDIWEHCIRLDRETGHSESERRAETGSAVADSVPRVSAALARVETLINRHEHSAAWRDYLLLPSIAAVAKLPAGSDESDRRALARRVLARISSPQLTPSQRKILREPGMLSLEQVLRQWASEPVHRDRLLTDLESFEQDPSAESAYRLAQDSRWLSWSADESAGRLGTEIDVHYRNANLRLAVAGSLINRFVPQPKAIESAVNEVIAGVPVAGRSTTFSRLTLKLIPDQNRLRLGLEAKGVVNSRTAATSGPATFHNSGQSNFIVAKLFVMGPRGLRVWPALAETENYRSDLVGLETTYDRVPLVGGFVRSMAQSQLEEKQDEARRESEQRVTLRTQQQFDTQVQAQVALASARFESRVLDPLLRLRLDPQLISAATSEDRLVMRCRLAGADQLGAFTPRPRAPSDSMISLQLHESALNNALQNLDLDGRTFELPELIAWVAKKLGRPMPRLPDDLPPGVRLTFAAHDAIRVRCNDGRVEIRLSLAELGEERKRWRNFAVRAYYRPDPDALQARFVRDSSIYLDGASLRGKPQIVLRGVFSKILSSQRQWSLVDDKLAADPRIQDLQVTQFTAEDGWIGLAYGPRRSTERVVRKPKP